VFLEPNEDVQIQDVFVPRGTPILALSGYVGTQDKNFAQADEFRPERWLEPGDVHNTKAFMPFGAGARFCPGRQLAMLQIKMITAMLCRDFEVARPKETPAMEDIYNFTVGPTHVYAALRPRRPARRGIDVEFRDGTRRNYALPIAFPDRRVAERRQHAESAR
jgi:cytochrome P450